MGTTYNLGVIVFVRVGLHVPYNLVRKELGELCSLNNVALNIAQCIISKCLHDLRDVKEGHINRVTLKRPHGILDQERMVLIRWQEVCDRGDWIDGSPEQQELHKLGQAQKDLYGRKTHPQLVADVAGQGSTQEDWQSLGLPHSLLRVCKKQRSDLLMDSRRLEPSAKLYCQ